MAENFYFSFNCWSTIRTGSFCFLHSPGKTFILLFQLEYAPKNRKSLLSVGHKQEIKSTVCDDVLHLAMFYSFNRCERARWRTAMDIDTMCTHGQQPLSFYGSAIRKSVGQSS